MIAALLLSAALWQKAATPYFDMLSTGAETESRAALAALDATRLRAEKITGWRTRGGPVRVVAAANVETGYRYWLGRDLMLVAPPHYAEASLEYARLWLRRSGRDLPSWMVEGLARSIAAAPVEAVADPLPLELLLAADFRHVPAAQARAFAEYLQSTLKDRFPALLDSLALHQDAKPALEWTMNRNLARMESELASFRPGAVRLESKEPAATRATASAAEAELAECATLEEEAARQRVQAQTQRYPKDPQVWWAWAAAAEDETRKREACEKAWQLGGADIEGLWQYATLLAEGAGRTAVLEKLIQADPAQWEARLALARTALAQKAVERARKVLAPLPEPSAPEAAEYYRVQSHAARLAENKAEARAAADRLTAIARTDTLRREADELTRIANDMNDAAAAKASQGITMKDNRPGAGGLGERRAERRPLPETYGPKVVEGQAMPSLEGRLTRVDCSGTQATLHIEVNGETRRFRIFDGKQVVVRSSGGAEAEIPCGVLASPLRVRAEYEAGDEPVLRILEFL